MQGAATDTDGQMLADRLEDESDSFQVVESDSGGIYVETESFTGTHGVGYSANGARMQDKGIYRLKDGGRVEIEVDCPVPDELREHFHAEFGGTANGRRR